MSYSEQTLAELRRERERLVRVRDDANADIEALDKVLGRTAGNVLRLENTSSPEKRYSESGLREAIRDVLGHASGFVKPKEIARRIVQGGYRMQDGSTTLPIRISNELTRMAKRGELVRAKNRGGGWAILKDKSVEGSLR